MDKGKPHNTAIKSLAFKYIELLSAGKHTQYNESKYLEVLKHRGSSLLEYAVKS